MTDYVPREHLAVTATVDLAHRIHREVGPGLPESLYEEMLARGLSEKGFEVQTQVRVPSVRPRAADEGFQADLIIDDCILIELKSLDSLHADHHREVLRNLDMSNLSMALLVNFGEANLEDGIFHFYDRPDGLALSSGRGKSSGRKLLFTDPV
jgi:GxxExxY protein